MQNWIFAVGLLSVFSFSNFAFSEEEPKRLIQVSPTRKVWMSQLEIHQLSHKIHHEEGHCGGFKDVTDFPEMERRFFEPFQIDYSKRSIRHSATVEPLLNELSPTVLANIVTKLSSFPTRHHNTNDGLKASNWIFQQFQTLASSRSDITVKQVTHSFKQPSIIVQIPGTGSESSEKVILGAHLDSINSSGIFPNPANPAPGADDDASGIATLMEVFRVVVESGVKFDRTIEFIAYAGEEGGLLGSQDIARDYSKRGEVVAAIMQLDMTMYRGTILPVIQMIQDNTHASLNTFVTQLIDQYVKIPWKTFKCGYACSDHASWNDLGYPATFPFEAKMNSEIHTVGDLPKILDVTFGLHFAKLAFAYLVEIGNE